MAVLRHLETLIHVTPLIVRAADAANGQMVSSGLRWTAIPTLRPGVGTTAFVTGSGLYGFEGLSGLRDHEYFTEATLPANTNVAHSPILSPALTSPSTGRPFLILVEDTAGRFLSWAVTLTLPRSKVFLAPLFSSPARTALPGMGVIRGAVKDNTRLAADGSRLPAAYAVVEARYDPTSVELDGVGIADARGEFALFLPFPNPLRPPAGAPITSPNTAGRLTIAQQTWPLTLTFAYQPTHQRVFCVRFDNRIETLTGLDSAQVAQRMAQGWTCAPDIHSLLTQPPVSVFGTAGGASAASLQVGVAFGKETVARTTGGDGGVWVMP